MSVVTKRNYKATFIIDTRGLENPVEDLIDELKTLVESLDGEGVASDDLGTRNFSYIKKKAFTQGHYLQLVVSAPSTFEKSIQDKLRLDKRIHRILVQSV